MHSPPFWHGLDSHSSISVSQKVPVYPGGHWQTKPLVWSTHRPWTHGSDAHSSTPFGSQVPFAGLQVSPGSQATGGKIQAPVSGSQELIVHRLLSVQVRGTLEQRVAGGAVPGGVAGVDGAGVAVVAELGAVRGALAGEVAVAQMGLQRVLADGDGLEVGGVARRDVAHFHLVVRRGRPGEQQDQGAGEKACQGRSTFHDQISFRSVAG
jgi:hypothetical protein